MSSYKEPDWAKSPPSTDCEWTLVEIKAGVEVAKHRLTKGVTILGRASDMVEITLQHESASRQHARIAFDASGIPWLRDLQSTHGTVCNKRKLPAAAVGKIESSSNQAGARGVILYPGDVLQFGGSTRLYCVEGPAEFERGAMELRNKMKATKSSSSPFSTFVAQPPTQPKSHQEHQQDDGVSWGMDMNDHPEDLDISTESSSTTSNNTLPKDVEIPEKHRKAFERLNAMKYKLTNLQTEDDRIQRKEELTEGQEKQLQRNAERETALKESIANLEQDLYQKLNPEKVPQNAASRRRRGRTDHAVDEEEESADFFDRTKEKHEDSLIDTEGESEKTLTAKWKNLYQQLRQNQAKLEQAKRHQAGLEEDLAQALQAGSEETFFISNDINIAKEAVQKVLNEAALAQKSIPEIEKLLRIVNSKLVVDRTTGYIGEGPPPPPSSDRHETPTHQLPRQPQTNNSDDNDAMAGSSDRMVPPISDRMGPPIDASKNNKSFYDENSDRMMPPPAVLPTKAVESISNKTAEPSPIIMPPPKSVLPGDGDGINNDRSSLSTEPSEISNWIMPPPKRARIVGPAMPPPVPTSTSEPSFSSTRSEESSSPAPIKGPALPHRPPPKGTLAMLSAMTENTSSRAPPPQSKISHAKSMVPAFSDPKTKKDEWRAPQDQDGSGITKLNAKFVGRY
jgi:pSer/pThr/pTyr-binding forkhead associated (FHA) protein